MTRSKYLPHILDCPEVKVQLYSRFASFYEACINSHNKVVNICCLFPSTRSVFKQNIQYLMTHLGLSHSELNALSERKKFKNFVLNHWYDSIDPVDVAESHLIMELLEIRNNNASVEGFDFIELKDSLTPICTLR